MATLTVQTMAVGGFEPTYTAADAGLADVFANPDERVVFEVVNGGGGACTVTIAATKDCNHGFTHDVVVAVPAAETRLFGPFDKDRFNNATNGIDVTYDQVTSVTVAALRMLQSP